MLVSVAIFAVVMTIALGSLLSMSESDRRAQTLKSVINNLNFSLDAMSRSMRTGQNYHCDITLGSAPSASRDCTGISPSPPPASSFAFLSADGVTGVEYCLAGGQIMRAITAPASLPTSCAGASFSEITAKEVTIQSLQFYVTGAEVTSIQPKVTILISGTVTVSATQTSTFNLQTSVTQRLYDQ